MNNLSAGTILSMVEGETTVPAVMLMENSDFVELFRATESVQELIDWVNENF